MVPKFLEAEQGIKVQRVVGEQSNNPLRDVVHKVARRVVVTEKMESPME